MSTLLIVANIFKQNFVKDSEAAICWDLCLYSLDFNFLSNNNLVHFQPKFSNYLPINIITQMFKSLTHSLLRQATLWYWFLLSIKCQLSFKWLSNAWHLNKLLDLASHTLKSIFKAEGHQLRVEWRLRSL